MKKLMHLLSDFFSKSEYDLNGGCFKKNYCKEKDNLLLDVRTIAAYKSGSFPAALNLDYLSPSFPLILETCLKDKKYFVFCRS